MDRACAGWVLASGLLTTWAAGAAEPAGDAALRKLIAERMEEAAIVGLGAAVLVDGAVVWMAGFGEAGRGIPFTPETVVPVGSITKTVTGLAMMRAVQDGKLALDQDVSRHLPFKVANPHEPGTPITLRHLATHTSSIVDRMPVYRRAYHFDGESPQPLGAFLEAYLVAGGATWSPDNFAREKPGAHREYSNIGAALAGFVVERAVGESLQAYTRRHVFEPLGMRHTGWSRAELPDATHSRPYVAQYGLAIPVPHYQTTTYPDGGLRSSVADLSRLLAALVGGSGGVLDAETLREMKRFQFSAENKPANMDLEKENSGLFWATKFNKTRVGHGGSDPGVRAEMLASPSGEIGIVVLANTSLDGPALGSFVPILQALWKHGEAVKAAAPRD